MNQSVQKFSIKTEKKNLDSGSRKQAAIYA